MARIPPIPNFENLADSPASVAMTPVFVDGLQASAAESTKGPPRLYHKKSKTGCQRCRARRVKCNEAHPVCQSCERHNLPCIYDRAKPTSQERPSPIATASPTSTNPRSTTHSSYSNSSIKTEELPETRTRRLQELRLLHHYATKTSPTLLSEQNREIVEGWSVDIPNLAFSNDALLYSLYAISALHLAKSTSTGTSEILSIHQRYLDLALREHRQAISALSPANADAVLLTSHFIRMTSFSNLAERSLVPTYEPPLQWLQMASGVWNVFAAAWDWLAADPNSLTIRHLARSKIFTTKPNQKLDEPLFVETRDVDLLQLLRRKTPVGQAAVCYEAESESWDEVVQEAYASTVNYIGGVKAAMGNGDDPSEVCRRLVAFPVMVKPEFVELVALARPRALVVLAYYFGLLSLFRGVWWIGEAGPREVRGICSVLADEWQDLMAWPLDSVEQKPVL